MSQFSRLLSGLTIPRSGGVNYGDIVAQISVRPTQHMLGLAETAGVPGGNGYASGDTYDAVQVALYWAQVGKVMPLKSPDEMFRDSDDISQGGKIPAFKGGQYEQGTRDPEEIKRIWSDDPGRGIGLPTQANRVLAIDVDNGPGKTGEFNFVELCRALGVPLDEVPCSKSPSYHGGYHLLWKLPNGFPKMSLPAVSSIAQHVDIPWFIVVAGSWKHTTVGYDRKGVAIKGIGTQTWHAGDPLQLPTAPKPLLDKILRRGVVKGVPATELTPGSAFGAHYKTDRAGTIDIEHYDKHGLPIGQQNVLLYRIACKMAGRSMNIPKPDAISWCWAIISRSPNAAGRESWSRYQVENMVDGAYTWVNADNAAADAANEELLRKLDQEEGPKQVNASHNPQSVTVNTADLTPVAAQAFTQLMEVLGDKGNLIWQPEFQAKLRNAMADEAIEEYLYQWETPSELNSNTGLPVFPLQSMPPVLRAVVEGLAEEKQVAVDLVAVIALAALAASLVGRVKVHVRGSWEEVVTLYALGLADSGNRKTGINGPLIKPLFEAQEQLRERLEEQRVEVLKQRTAAEFRFRSASKRASKDSATLADFAEVAEAQAEMDAIQVPELPTLVATDATPEAMVVRMQANGERLAVFDAEGGGLTTMAGVRYGNANASNIDLLLKGHVGEPVSQMRVGRGEVTLAHPVISIGMLSQFETLRQLVAVPGSSGRGLVDRFLIAAPADRLGQRKILTTTTPQGAKDAYGALLTSYAHALWGEEEPKKLWLSADAVDAVMAFEERCEARLVPSGDLRVLGGFGSKLVGSAVRLAALHHLAIYGAAAAFYTEIGYTSVEWGIAVAEWSVHHYRYAVATAGEIADISDAARVLEWLKRRAKKTSTIAQRDVQRGTGMSKAEEVQKALELLAEHNYVRPAREPRRSGPGRQAKNWEVHPGLLDGSVNAA